MIDHSRTTLPFISIIVLNFNSMVHLRDNLESLLHLDYPSDLVELLLVDNASTDGSTEWVSANYPNVRIVRNGVNLGFAAGNTAGAEAAQGEWVVILNPDIRVRSNWLKELVRVALQDKDTVCVGSRMLSWDGQTIDFADAAMNFMGWGCQPGFQSRHLDEYDQDKPLLFACGGAMLIRRDVFLEVGGFDADYFAYYEDVDLGWRLWLLGYKVMLAADAVVYHRHHGSWGNVPDAKKWLLSERNTLFTVIKNYDDNSLAQVLPAALLLVAERSYLDIRPDPIAFENIPSTTVTPIGAVFGPRYYLVQLYQLLRQGDLKALWHRTVDEIRRRWSRVASEWSASKPTHPQPQPVNGFFTVSAIPFSRLLAGRDVLHALPELLEKRRFVQAARQRSDAEIFPLFQWALISNFGDEQFIQAMNIVIARFDLVTLFNKSGSQLRSSDVYQLSHEVALLLLQIMDRAFCLSNVPEAVFRLGGETPHPMMTVPEASVALLVELHHLLWSLPDLPWESLLAWLREKLTLLLEKTVDPFEN